MVFLAPIVWYCRLRLYIGEFWFRCGVNALDLDAVPWFCEESWSGQSGNVSGGENGGRGGFSVK